MNSSFRLELSSRSGGRFGRTCKAFVAASLREKSHSCLSHVLWRTFAVAVTIAFLSTSALSAEHELARVLSQEFRDAVTPHRPVHTYSIVARDSATGELGVAVQSHWFSVGSVVPWAEAGVGAVATQSMAEISYGPLGLELMRAGKSAGQALKALLQADEHPEWRQVAMIDASGRVAVHTGEKCIREAGHHAGAQYSVQANLMEKNTVWNAMADAYESASGDLAARMLAALEAAQGEGGDIRGKQSAAILIVKERSSGRPYLDRVMDLRVEDHPEPVKELKRLVELNRAYELMNKGDEHVAAGEIKEAMESYGEAMRLAPGNPEVQFWAAVTMFTQGSEAEALRYFKEVFKADRNWAEVVRRLPEAGLLPADEKKIEKILSVAP